MNLLLDTHIWLRWLSADQPLDERIVVLIEEAERIAVSAVSCWEVAYLAKKKRIGLPMELSEWLHSALGGSGVEVISLSAGIAVSAAALPDIHRDPADRFIIATALDGGFHLVSLDGLFKEYEVLKDRLVS